jgi:hypothetical protein
MTTTSLIDLALDSPTPLVSPTRPKAFCVVVVAVVGVEMRWFRVLTIFATMAAASCTGAADKDVASDDLGTVPTDADADADFDADADADFDSDTSTDPDPAGPTPTLLSPVSAAGVVSGRQFSVALTVGVPINEHQLQTTHHTISLGIGLAVAP